MSVLSRLVEFVHVQDRPGTSGATHPAEQMFGIVAVQLLVTFSVAAVCWLFDWIVAASALAGGLAVAIPGAFVAWRFVSAGRRAGAQTLLVSETGKWVLTMGVFVLTFVLIEPSLVAMFGLFAALQLVPLLGALHGTR